MHLQRQPRDVLGVGEIGLVLDGEVAHRGLAHVREQRLLLAEDRARQEDAVAQAGLGHLDAR